LDKAEAGVQQFLKDFKFGKPTPVVMKKAGGTVLLTAALCSAMGVPDPWGCRHHVENEKISPEEINKLQQALSSQNTVNKLNQLTDEESQLLFGF
jgi:hypothetical protein